MNEERRVNGSLRGDRGSGRMEVKGGVAVREPTQIRYFARCAVFCVSMGYLVQF